MKTHVGPVRGDLLKNYKIEDNGCWAWLGAISDKGYGTYWDGKKSARAHRLLYEAHKGAIPEGLVLDHLCRNKSCVNPDHLEAVTSGENVLRGVGISAQNAAKTHCKQGHPLSGDNLLVRYGRRRYSDSNEKYAMRSCRICQAVFNKTSYDRTRAKFYKAEQALENYRATILTALCEALEEAAVGVELHYDMYGFDRATSIAEGLRSAIAITRTTLSGDASETV